MTSLLPDRSGTRPGPRSGTATSARGRRPLTLVATLGGVLAAAGPLALCLLVGVAGWFVVDAGTHGAPRDGLRIGALGWLLGHGSGVYVGGVPVTAVPLGVTLLAAWSVWRTALRVGDAVSSYGPDADGIVDGERDWTVPVAAVLFGAGYVVVAVVTVTLASTPRTNPDTGGVIAWAAGLCVLLGLPGIAIGTGRAAIWAQAVPAVVRDGLATALVVLRGWLLLSLVALVAAFVVDLGTAANVLSQLHASPGDAVAFVVVSLLVLPNAAVFSSAYLLGPGFTVGTGTLVSPASVVLGPLPMFPLLAALPDAGTPPAWTAALVAVPPLVAALLVARAQHRNPTQRWDEGALRGLVGGVAAGLALGVLASLAGGAVGPGRMTDVAPLAGDVLVQAVTTFGLGGLLGGVAMTAWQRRAARR